MSAIVQHAWKRFGIITSIIGDFQGRAIVTLLYFTLLVPFGIGYRMTGDPLRLKEREGRWLKRDAVDETLEAAQRQG